MDTEVEVKVWQLTNEEIMHLHDNSLRRIGIQRMLEDIAHIEAQAVRAEERWWNDAMKDHNIDEKYRVNLIADAKLGKVWVKGEVPELDKIISERGLLT